MVFVETYAVVMTKGAYVVKSSCAERILEAVQQSEPHILVEADLLGDGMYYSPVRLVTAHVVAIVKNSVAQPNSAVSVAGLRVLPD